MQLNSQRKLQKGFWPAVIKLYWKMLFRRYSTGEQALADLNRVRTLMGKDPIGLGELHRGPKY